MLQELLVSVVSGIVVAMILGMFGMGGNGSPPPAPRQSVRYYEAPPPRRRRSFLGGVLRLILSVAGGLALAAVAMPFVFGRHFGRYDDYDRFDQGFRNIGSHGPGLILTVIGTVIVWTVLSAISRR